MIITKSGLNHNQCIYYYNKDSDCMLHRSKFCLNKKYILEIIYFELIIEKKN